MRIDVVLILLLAALIGCGYAISDNIHLREQLRMAQTDIADLKSQNSAVVAELDGQKEENRGLNDSLEACQVETRGLNDRLEACQVEARGLNEAVVETQRSLEETELKLVEITLANQYISTENGNLRNDLEICSLDVESLRQTIQIQDDASLLSDTVLAGGNSGMNWIEVCALVLIVLARGLVTWLKKGDSVQIPSGYIKVTEKERQVISGLRRGQVRQGRP